MIRFQIRGNVELEKFLKSLPRGTMRAAIEALTKYLIGDNSHGLKYYPAYKKVSRTMAYGKPFASDKQRRWFFANLKDGSLKIPYSRTGQLAHGWKMGGDEYRRTIKQSVPYAKWVMGDGTQSAMSRKIGWRTRAKVIADNMKGGMRAATQAVARWLKDNTK